MGGAGAHTHTDTLAPPCAAGPELGAVLALKITDGSTRALRAASVKAVSARALWGPPMIHYPYRTLSPSPAQVLIGRVPDRGGRVAEMRISARDLMPSWQARSTMEGREGHLSTPTLSPT